MAKRRKAFVLAVSLVGLTAFKTNAQQKNDTTKTQTLICYQSYHQRGLY